MNLSGMISHMQMGMPQHAPGPSGVVAHPEPVKAASKAPGNPASHLTAAHSAAKAGDHHAAKKHALKAVNLLHRMAPPAENPAAAV